MFKLRAENEIFDSLERKERSLMRLDKLAISDAIYLDFLAHYEGIGLTADLEIFGYEEALKENRYLSEINSDIAAALWKIGRTGQGDEWFIHKEEGNILFYNHDGGEYSSTIYFQDLKIYFFNFLQMALLYRDLEELLNQNDDEIEESAQTDFEERINSIQPDLYRLYPFQYF